MSLKNLKGIKSNSEILVCEDYIFGKNIAPEGSIDLVLKESFKGYEKALINNIEEQGLNNYKDYLFKEKAIDKLLKDVLNRLQLKITYFDHSLLEYEKYIFVYGLENNLYTEDELNSIANKEDIRYLNHLSEKYGVNNQEDLIDVLKNLSDQKSIQVIHLDGEKERLIDNYDDPHFVCVDCF